MSKQEATRLADALMGSAIMLRTYTAEVDVYALAEATDKLRQWPDGEPVGAVLVNRDSREGVMFYSMDMLPDPETLKDRFELVKVYTAPPDQSARIAELEAQLQEAITHLREMTTVPDLNAVKQARRWLDSTAIKATGGTT